MSIYRAQVVIGLGNGWCYTSAVFGCTYVCM